MHPICRTCLYEGSEDNFLALTEDTESLRVKTELSVCVPEIVVDIVINAVVCFKCIYALHSAYEFKTQCLQTEERINNYIKNKNPDLNFDSRVLKLEFPNLQSSITTSNETSINACLKPTTTLGIIDDLNNLLNEELQNAPRHCEVFIDETKHVKCEDDYFEQSIFEPPEISYSDEDKKPIILQNDTTPKECSVICRQLAGNVFNSKLTMISPTQNITPNTKHQSSEGIVFKCTECAYENSNKSNLQRHKYKHTGIKRFVCNVCNYRFGSTSNLKNHMRTHTGEKPYVCKLCPYKSAFPSALKRHITKMHNSDEASLKPFACKLCSYRGAIVKQLNGHIRRIHMNNTLKRFVCKMCLYKSSYKHCLIRHIQRVHSSEKPSDSNM